MKKVSPSLVMDFTERHYDGSLRYRSIALEALACGGKREVIALRVHKNVRR
jgi:hypothetical protein